MQLEINALLKGSVSPRYCKYKFNIYLILCTYHLKCNVSVFKQTPKRHRLRLLSVSSRTLRYNAINI